MASQIIWGAVKSGLKAFLVAFLAQIVIILQTDIDLITFSNCWQLLILPGIAAGIKAVWKGFDIKFAGNE